MTTWQWWCAARPDVWDWSWPAYPGVWILVGLAVVGTTSLNLPLGESEQRAWGLNSARPGASTPMLPSHIPWWTRPCQVLGLFVLWLALDWPVGPLGTGYLAWVHAVQFVALAMLVPALLLLGLGSEAQQRIACWRHTPRLIVTRPAVALPLFAAVMIVSHLPPVSDRLMATASGAFALDMAWLLSGLAFVWPLVLSSHDRQPMSPLTRVGYIFVGTIAHVFIGMWLLVADYPLYATYELAPPFTALTPRMDQQFAGGVMLLVGTPLVVFALGLNFRALATDVADET